MFDDVLSRLYCDSGADDLALFEAISNFASLFSSGLLEFGEDAEFRPPWVTGSFEIFYPENLQVEITAACNLRCSYCYRNAQFGKRDSRLATNDLLRILAALRAKGLNSVELTGGEPFFHPDFANIVEFCATNFTLVGLLTNGSLITEESLRPLLSHKTKFVVSVSLDSHIPQVHDQRRGRWGAFERTLSGIRLLVSSGFLTRVSMSVDEKNWPDIEETLLLAKSLGAFAFAYSPILPFGRGKRGFRLWSASAQNVAETETALQQKYQGFLDLVPESTMLKLGQPGSCGAGHRVYAMDPNGYVRPCVIFGTSQAILGCLASESPEEIFGTKLSRRFAELRAPDRETCGDCKWSLFCRNCVYRGLVASAWAGQENCNWLRHPMSQLWHDEVRSHSRTLRR